MGEPLSDLTFEEWVAFIFDRPVVQRPWYQWLQPFPDEDYWEASPTVTVEYLARLFEEAGRLLAPFSDAQVAAGLELMCREEYFHMLGGTLGPSAAPWPARRRGLLSVYPLFEQCFARRCSPYLAHRNQKDTNPLNGVCYMWWERFEAWYPLDHPDRAPAYEITLEVMERCLSLESDPCRESALHGLSHWHLYYPQQVECAIDAFLALNPDLPKALKSYAREARRGNLL